MKRAMFGKAGSAALLAALTTACAPPATPEAPREVESVAAGWTRPPEIQAVHRARSGLVFTGTAEPMARVVLRSDSGAAYAAAADARGRFEIRMAAPTGDLWLRAETQVGQDAAPSPDRLLIVGDGRGPIAILRAGGPTRRLDRAPALGAVDSDGRMRLASGRTTKSTPVLVQAAGESVRVSPDGEGRWSLMLRPASGPDAIEADGARFEWPGDARAAGGPRVERAGDGWRVRWLGADGAPQSTWLPDTV